MATNTKQFGQGDTFTISRAEFYRAWYAGRAGFGNEYIGYYDRHDWSGRHYRHFPGIGGVRWDGGDPGDEHVED